MYTAKVGFSLLIASWLAVPLWAERTIDEQLTADPKGLVEVYNLSGSVRISSWQEDKVEVKGTLGQGVERLEFKREGNRIVVRPIIPQNAKNVKASHLELQVPAYNQIQVKTVSADVEIDKGKGNIEVETVSGYIRIGGQSGEIDAHSISGNIEIRAKTPRVLTKSVSGNIEVQAKTPRVTTKSVSGNIDLEVEGEEVQGETVSGWIKASVDKLVRGNFKSVSGNIWFDGQLKKDSRLEANNHSGNIELLFAEKIEADFRLATFSGQITNHLGPAAQSTGDYTPGKRLDFSTGAGGARVTAKTFSGNVSLDQK